MKEQADLFSGEHGMLFGDKFQNFVIKMVKTRQNSEDLFKSMNKGKLQPLQHDIIKKKIISDGGEGCRIYYFFWEDQIRITELQQLAVTGKALQVKIH